MKQFTAISSLLCGIALMFIISCNREQKEFRKMEQGIPAESGKTMFADSSLALLDEIYEQYLGIAEPEMLSEMSLSSTEKVIKPEYLLDPKNADTYVGRDQKMAALAFLSTERFVRKLYDMPTKASGQAIKKLALETNYPFNFDKIKDKPMSERVRKIYQVCRNRNDMDIFWEFQFNILVEKDYILAQDPESFLGKINQEQLEAWRKHYILVKKAVTLLAPYDEEMNKLNGFLASNLVQENVLINGTIEDLIGFYSDNKDYFISRRNKMIE